MEIKTYSVKEDYWENIEINEDDLELLYTNLLELETPQSPLEMISVLINDRIEKEKAIIEQMSSSESKTYLPKEDFEIGEKLIFPALDYLEGEVRKVRDANVVVPEQFKVIQVEFEGGEIRELAAGYDDHILNKPQEVEIDPLLEADYVLENFGDEVSQRLVEELEKNDDFVYIAGRYFPAALLVDVSVGNLNIAEAVLDMAKGGPLSPEELLQQVELPSGINEKLAVFSLDNAMQQDARFDEVGIVGQVSWFLKRLEPDDVQTTPIFLEYDPIEYDRDLIDEQMLSLEKRIDDELSELEYNDEAIIEFEVNLIFPHWHSGTLPLTSKLSTLFPTAYESPRVRFKFIDGKTGDEFPGWVVRSQKYVYGLKDWYVENGVMPGSKVNLKLGDNPGEIIVSIKSHRSAKEWVRTALIGADGGVVYAMLKQPVSTSFDDWMMIAMPSEVGVLKEVWEKNIINPPAFEQVVVNTLRELAKLNPQSHVHAAELYSALNVVFRCPPGPLMALLSSRPWFKHVGDLHFRFEDSDE